MALQQATQEQVPLNIKTPIWVSDISALGRDKE
jgi:hypothetical protein